MANKGWIDSILFVMALFLFTRYMRDEPRSKVKRHQ